MQFGGSHLTTASDTFSNLDIRLDMNSNYGGDTSEALRLQGGAGGLVESLNDISNVPGPPMYSPPPTYEQVLLFFFFS